ASEPCPSATPTAIDVLEFQSRFVEERAERNIACLTELGDQTEPVDSERGQDVADHEVGRDAVKFDVAAGWQRREAVLDLAGEPSAAHARQRAIPEVEAKLGGLVADEVEDGQARLVVGEPQAAAQ